MSSPGYRRPGLRAAGTGHTRPVGPASPGLALQGVRPHGGGGPAYGRWWGRLGQGNWVNGAPSTDRQPRAGAGHPEEEELGVGPSGRGAMAALGEMLEEGAVRNKRAREQMHGGPCAPCARSYLMLEKKASWVWRWGASGRGGKLRREALASAGRRAQAEPDATGQGHLTHRSVRAQVCAGTHAYTRMHMHPQVQCTQAHARMHMPADGDVHAHRTPVMRLHVNAQYA